MTRRVLSLLLLFAFVAVSYCVYSGVPVSQGDFPYLVYIMVNPGDSDTYACGGGIINRHYVMSAGHCSWGRKFQIIVGRKSVDGYRSSDVVEVASVVRHDYFNKDGIFDYNDIAIWQLATPLDEKPGFIEYMHIGLNPPPVGTQLTLVGFGMIGLGKNTPDAHYGRIHVAEDAQCTFASYRPEVSYCSNNTDYYSCPGDSGTPIVVKPVGAERFISVGINSYGHDGPCGNKNPATVIAKVSTMIDWIKRVTPLEQPVFKTIDYELLKFAPPALVLPGETPVPTPQCNTCEPGWSHWFDYGYTAPTNGDVCQCVQGTRAPETTRAASNDATRLNGLLVVLVGVMISLVL